MNIRKTLDFEGKATSADRLLLAEASTLIRGAHDHMRSVIWVRQLARNHGRNKYVTQMEVKQSLEIAAYRFSEAAFRFEELQRINVGNAAIESQAAKAAFRLRRLVEKLPTTRDALEKYGLPYIDDQHIKQRTLLTRIKGALRRNRT